MYHVLISCVANGADVSGGQDADSSHGNHGSPKVCIEGVGRGRQGVHLATRAGIVAEFLVDPEQSLVDLQILVVARVKRKL